MGRRSFIGIPVSGFWNLDSGFADRDFGWRESRSWIPFRDFGFADHELKTVIAGDGSKKLIHVISQQRFELYDLARDPGEKKNLWGDVAAKPARDEMSALMAHFVDVVLAKQ
jgi:hypothetical protein